MLHHVSFGSNDVSRARAFYVPVCEVLGLKLHRESANALDFGYATFVFSVETPLNGRPATAGNGAHVAFMVETREVVQRFHRTALAHGGRDDGAPGLRPEYDPNYYGAFVLDPDGNKIEALTYAAR